MPTPSNEPVAADSPTHSHCPPEDERSSWRSAEIDDINEATTTPEPEVIQQPTPPPSDSHISSAAEAYITDNQSKQIDMEEEITAPDMLSPVSGDGEKTEDNELAALTSAYPSSPSMGYEFSNIRVRL